MKQALQHSAVKFLVVGGVSLSVDYGLLLLFYHGLYLSLPLATTLAYLLGLIVNFTLNKIWSFQAEGSARKTTRQAILYSLLVGVNLLFNNFFIVYLNTLSIEPEYSKPICVLILMTMNYFVYKYVIFTNKR